jgi:hypothetical protein
MSLTVVCVPHSLDSGIAGMEGFVDAMGGEASRGGTERRHGVATPFTQDANVNKQLAKSIHSELTIHRHTDLRKISLAHKRVHQEVAPVGWIEDYLGCAPSWNFHDDLGREGR